VNDPKLRQRLTWIAAIGGVLVVALLFVSLAAPSRPGTTDPVLRTETATPQADESLTGNAQPEVTGGGGFSFGAGDAASLAWRLGLVAVIIAVSIAGLRWWGRKASSPSSVTGFIRIVDTLGISNGRTIHLLALGERVIVVGATAQQLTFLSELSADEVAQVRVQGGKPADVPLASFAAELFQSMRKAPGRAPEPEQSAVIGAEDFPAIVRPQRPRL
jgi:flagellar protein FliO/FliZ